MNRLESRRGWCVYGSGVKAAVSRFDSARKNLEKLRFAAQGDHGSTLCPFENTTVLSVHPGGMVDQYLSTGRGE